MAQDQGVFTEAEAVDYARFLCEDEAGSINSTRMGQLLFEAMQVYYTEVETGIQFLAPTVSGATVPQNEFRVEISFDWHINDVVAAYVMSAAGQGQDVTPTGIPERIELHRMIQLHVDDDSTATIPSYYAVERIDPLDDSTAGSETNHAIWIHPAAAPAAGVHLLLACHLSPGEWGASGSTLLGTDPVGSNAVARMAAIQAAIILSRPREMIQQLIAGLPDNAKQLYKNMELTHKPVVRQMEEAV